VTAVSIAAALAGLCHQVVVLVCAAATAAFAAGAGVAMCVRLIFRLEEMNDKRQSMVQKLKGVEKELQGLEGRKLEAEAYIAKQAERLQLRITGNSIELHHREVGPLLPCSTCSLLECWCVCSWQHLACCQPQ
jgi:hypothetical protein